MAAPSTVMPQRAKAPRTVSRSVREQPLVLAHLKYLPNGTLQANSLDQARVELHLEWMSTTVLGSALYHLAKDGFIVHSQYPVVEAATGQRRKHQWRVLPDKPKSS